MLDWIGTLRAEGKSPRTVRSYAIAVRMLLEFTGGAMPSRRDIRAFMAQELARTAPASATCCLRGIKSFCRWLTAEGEAEADVTIGVREPFVPPVPVHVLANGELCRLLESSRISLGRQP